MCRTFDGAEWSQEKNDYFVKINPICYVMIWGGGYHYTLRGGGRGKISNLPFGQYIVTVKVSGQI